MHSRYAISPPPSSPSSGTSLTGASLATPAIFILDFSAASRASVFGAGSVDQWEASEPRKNAVVVASARD